VVINLLDASGNPKITWTRKYVNEIGPGKRETRSVRETNDRAKLLRNWLLRAAQI